MEVYGANTPLRNDIEPLIQSIENNLNKITIEKLAEYLVKHTGSITKEDRNFIEGSDKQMLLAFPINDQ